MCMCDLVVIYTLHFITQLYTSMINILLKIPTHKYTYTLTYTNIFKIYLYITYI